MYTASRPVRFEADPVCVFYHSISLLLYHPVISGQARSRALQPKQLLRDVEKVPLAREQQKLAAILAADVVGYLRLMGRDESGTQASFQSTDTLPVPSTVSRTSVVPQWPFARHAPLLALPIMFTRL